HTRWPRDWSSDVCSSDLFLGRSFWTADYVGAGPYRLSRWEPGSFLEGEAFDGHVLGRPKIDRVILRIFSDENTVLAAVLAGDQRSEERRVGKEGRARGAQ